MPRPLSVALTGGLATGKSHCLMGFAAHGAVVIDADALARQVVEPGSPGLAAVVRRFGSDVLAGDGRLDRQALADIVFRDAGARHDLESIVHPLVYEAIERWLSSATAQVAVAEIPLLYETNLAVSFDKVVVAACSREEQQRRARARGLGDEEIEQRLDAQMPIEEKRRRADYVIDTSGTADETDRQLSAVWSQLVKSRPEPSPPRSS